MNPSSNAQGAFITFSRALLEVLLLISATSCLSAAQVSASPAASSAVREHFASAQEAQRQGDYAVAEREYRAVIAEEPNFAEVHMNLGLVYQLQDRTQEAMAEFRRALKINPTLTGANFFIGVNYCKNGEGASAVPYLKVASQQEPNRPDIWLWLATAQDQIGENQAEVTTLKHALGLQSLNIDTLYLLGSAYEKLGKQEVAKLEKAAPASSWSEQLLGESYSSSTQWSYAVIRFQNAIALSPNRPGLHVRLGEVFLHAGRLDQAAQEFERELQIDPSNLRAVVRRGEAKLIEGDTDSALDDWTRALAIDKPRTERILGISGPEFGGAVPEQLPDSLRERIQAVASKLSGHSSATELAVAFVAVQNGKASPDDTEQAANPIGALHAQTCGERDVVKRLDAGEYSSVSDCLPRLLTSHSSRDLRIETAEALFELGDYESALKALRATSTQQYPPAYFWRARCFEKLATQTYVRLYQTDPNSYRVHQLMGDLEAAKENDGKAIEEYRTALGLKPTVPDLHYSLGHLLWKDLKTDEARTQLNAELQLNPRHAGALHDLGASYLMEHQPEKALGYLSRALEADPQDPDIRRDLGTAYANLHDYGKAEAAFKAAIPSDQDGSIHYQLARIYQAQGRKADAAREFEISTSLNRESHAKLEKQTERINKIEETTSAHP
jgi:tetratricopeptide (TPR) repeat protein